jgi:hypothetical protein
MFSERVHTSFYYGALLLVVVALPFSLFALSVAQITLTVNWILEGKFRQKWEIFRKRPAVWLIALFYLVHLVWMANTSDISHGFHELRLKLPFLVLPFVISTSTPLSVKQLNTILKCFVSAVFICSLYSGFLVFGFDGRSSHTMTELSPFVWHIRWALMVVSAIFMISWLFQQEYQWQFRWVYIPVAIWLIIYLFLLKALTGIVVFALTSVIMLVWGLFQNPNMLVKWFIWIVLVTVILVPASYLTRAYARFHTFEKVDFSNLDKYTAKGNLYWHDTSKRYVENGHYMDIYICEQELREEWKKRSLLDFDGKTNNGEVLRFCLVRYLTSKGLRKDSAGIHRLTDRDITYIEAGTANYIDTNKYALYPRVYDSMWELYHYKLGANPTGHSLAQRLEFLKTAGHIIRGNVWFGVGTGDIPPAFARQFEIDNSPIPRNQIWWANNQLVTFWVSFGIIGFVLVWIAFIAPPFFEHKITDYLFLVICIVGFLSFLDEDTFETHAGISMFAVFYSLFLFYRPYETT